MTEIPFQFHSISVPSEGLYKDRGSKFHGYIYPVSTIGDIEQRLQELSSLHPKARHLCFAYRLGIEGDPYRINDDGEPSGSAGRPIFNELLSAGISDVLAVVVRYFGGTKLGVPGLIKAYKEATRDAIEKSEIIIITLSKKIKITYHIEDMGRIYELLKNRGISDIESNFVPDPHLIVSINLNEIPIIRQTILADYFGYQVDDIGDDFTTDRLEIEILE